MFNKNYSEIRTIIQSYFDGIFYGKVESLQGIFHPQSILTGDIKGEPYFKTIDEYLLVVKSRKSPSELGEMMEMKILAIEFLGNNAVVKLHCPMLGYNYYDFLSLSKCDGAWLIVNKIFSHVAES